MTSINLYQDPTKQEGGKKESIFSGGFFISLSVLVVTLLVYGGVKMYSASIVGKNVALAAQIQDEKTAISGHDELATITDFQKRVDVITADIGSKEYIKDVLQNISANLVSGITVTDFSYDGGTITLVMNADGFQNVAQQILSFKQSPHFTGVSVVNISRGDKDISFSIAMANNKKEAKK